MVPCRLVACSGGSPGDGNPHTLRIAEDSHLRGESDHNKPISRDRPSSSRASQSSDEGTVQGWSVRCQSSLSSVTPTPRARASGATPRRVETCDPCTDRVTVKAQARLHPSSIRHCSASATKWMAPLTAIRLSSARLAGRRSDLDRVLPALHRESYQTYAPACAASFAGSFPPRILRSLLCMTEGHRK